MSIYGPAPVSSRTRLEPVEMQTLLQPACHGPYRENPSCSPSTESTHDLAPTTSQNQPGLADTLFPHRRACLDPYTGRPSNSLFPTSTCDLAPVPFRTPPGLA